MRHRIRVDGCTRRLSVFCDRLSLQHLRFVRLGVLLGLFVCGAWAQGTPQSSASTPPVNAHGMEGNHERDAPAINPQMQEQMADHRNSDRQRQLVADTEKLFHLAEQLRDEVAKSNKDQLSVPVVKKSEEIEKLAKSVKDKMRGY